MPWLVSVGISVERAGIRFSIVVPTYRRKHSLRACLNGIAQLDYPRAEFEVVVVDDGSQDPPVEEVDGFTDRLNIRLITVTPNAGPAKARNTGAAAARGELLAMMDDDCVPDRDWLRQLEVRLQQFPGALVGGALRNGAPESLCAEAGQQLVDFLYRYYNSDIDHARWFMSANIACARTMFLDVGGFGTDFPLAAAEDRDFCDRWREAGHRLVLAPLARVAHVRPVGLRSFWQQHRTSGRGAHHLHQARARRRVALPSMEPLRFYARLLLFPFSSGAGWRAPVMVALLLTSQLAYALGYYPERRRAPIAPFTPEPDVAESTDVDSPPLRQNS